ncbi:hypothetical protein JOC78_003238 [Bacillus ectoiniformans]|uniref:YfhJ family protein n=1 Tax=Bacillus ectoiniformans TaxID=1494429 RepID=UPI00195A9544|nr:YfhJ family protein [Bacillus ectoiniformans]MBM7650253.1 hypothetical protein [Bacillus ectoiniformans]
MEDIIERLTALLLQKNDQLTYARARTWIELLWEDFEATYAKAGYKYQGREMTEKVVAQMIANYGDRLHDFAAINPKYKHLLDDDEDVTH